MVCAWGILNSHSVQAQQIDYLILKVPEQSPGAPWYVDFHRDFIPTDGEWVSIVFWRTPESVPADFNLLDSFDIPRAFGAPLLLEGEEWWVDPPLVVGNNVRLKMWNVDWVPVYFVKLDEFEANIQDDVLTLSELEAFDSLRIGQADFVRYDTRNEFHQNDNFGTNRGFYVASGIMEGGGHFNVRLFESPPDPETGLEPVDAVIVFTE
jgi:hypothetical protein